MEIPNSYHILPTWPFSWRDLILTQIVGFFSDEPRNSKPQIMSTPQPLHKSHTSFTQKSIWRTPWNKKIASRWNSLHYTLLKQVRAKALDFCSFPTEHKGESIELKRWTYTLSGISLKSVESFTWHSAVHLCLLYLEMRNSVCKREMQW